MSIKHFFITKKNENSILKEVDNQLVMIKKSNTPSKIFLSTLNMKTAIIHNKKRIFDCVDLNEFGKDTYSLKSRENSKYYSSNPLKTSNSPSSFVANRSNQQEWEHFNLDKTKNIMLHNEVLSTLNKISE
ncbi:MULTISPECIES: hypothetical protein [Commensalibacter]|uniref:Uncharacterized protein n=2 Tax=Commensalibacter TaxID=1079922 RepID=W7E277_9PROT|nr:MULTISPECIES: hypothetical protein [Commensalibacter]EUK19169.1 hypothetical protein COMX_05445 [Commensalibacter papalotli (ex Servin-Garciduenas et al. 2014)]CAI3930566.1 unnamed protein product [Commensalibacter papalotli (ex Botero et al. 2024)]CAI3948087.1 unnamed protein product [Commensalibacter papalotli (ex Botero et al. 2024)]